MHAPGRGDSRTSSALASTRYTVRGEQRCLTPFKLRRMVGGRLDRLPRAAGDRGRLGGRGSARAATCARGLPPPRPGAGVNRAHARDTVSDVAQRVTSRRCRRQRLDRAHTVRLVEYDEGFQGALQDLGNFFLEDRNQSSRPAAAWLEAWTVPASNVASPRVDRRGLGPSPTSPNGPQGALLTRRRQFE